MANGLPGIGPVNEPEEKPEAEPQKGKKHRFLNSEDIDWKAFAKGLIFIVALLGGLVGGGYQLISERSPVTNGAALAAQIEKVQGEVNTARAVTDQVDRRVTALESAVSNIRDDVSKTKESAAGTKADAENLKGQMTEVKEAVKKIDEKQQTIQEGIEKILRKLPK